MSEARLQATHLNLYRWEGVDTLGHLQTGELLSADELAVHQQLFALSLQPVNVKRQQRIRSTYWKGHDLIAFIRQLATLLQTGLPLVNSLTLLASEHSKAPWRCVLQSVFTGVREGIPLSEMLSQFPQVFPSIYPRIIAIGEVTGQLDNCCLQLALQQEKQAEINVKVKKALRYPLIVCSIAGIVTILMLTMVLPEFAKIYASFGAQLPWFTTLLIQVSTGLISYGPYAVVLLSLAIIYYLKQQHPKPLWLRREQQLLMRTPLIRRLISDSCLGQIFQTLAMTQQAGLTLIASLEASANATTNLLFEQAILDVKQQITLGMPLHEAFGRSPLFPSLCQQLIHIGEESGSLDEILLKIAQWHNQQANQLADTMAQSIEPLLMVIMGVLVGGLVIAMYLPIFQLGAAMG
jgi:protein transport protein HofC